MRAKKSAVSSPTETTAAVAQSKSRRFPQSHSQAASAVRAFSKTPITSPEFQIGSAL
jgi:hypothetical protein